MPLTDISFRGDVWFAGASVLLLLLGSAPASPRLARTPLPEADDALSPLFRPHLAPDLGSPGGQAPSPGPDAFSPEAGPPACLLLRPALRLWAV